MGNAILTEQIDGPRACAEAELPEVIQLVNAELRMGMDQSMLTDYPLVYRGINFLNIRILKVDGQLSSVVPFVPRPIVFENCEFVVAIISPTATTSVHRKKGYGLLCLNDCIARMKEVGCELSVLWTLPTTFPFYEKADYQGVRDQGWIYLCARDDASRFADNRENIALYNPKTRRHVEAIQAMHEAEVYGVRRAAAEYAALFGLPKMKTLIALRNGAPVAYLVVSRAKNKPGLIEAGGEESALQTLVHRTLTELDAADSFPAYSYRTDTVLGRLLERTLPGRRQPMTQGPMMVRVNNPSAFFLKIARHLEQKNAAVKRAFSIGVAGELISFEFAEGGLTLGSARLEIHLDFSRRELASVIFGSHASHPFDTPAVLGDLFPFYFPIWMLDHS